ncbi:(Fe-S)-binding protein [bacterium]|nr:(Fe-S)-binding protein [bacterium]
MSDAAIVSDPSSCELTLENLWESPEGHDLLTCMQCGVCAGTCPYGEAMQYPPRRIIAMLRAGRIEEVLASDSLMNCVACYACMTKCPRGIRLTEALLPLVKEQVFARLPEVPAELQKALQNTMRYGNPMGESPRKRAEWVKTAGVPIRILHEDPKPTDVLWFVECYTSYHPRGQDNSRATAKILHALGIDFAILGNEEKCAGECARLLGEAGLFDTLMDYNMAVLGKYQFKRILTAGAHAYDAFKYQYPALGFTYPFDHTTPFFAQYLDRLKPLLKKKLSYTVTYHDSCCIGRHNGFYEEPRALLQAIPGVKLAEMAHNRVNAICCGGGGGGMWLDTYYKAKGLERLSERRIKEAIATGADVLAVSCPYEVSRFEDALKVFGHDKKMIVRDVSELLAESLED